MNTTRFAARVGGGCFTALAVILSTACAIQYGAGDESEAEPAAETQDAVVTRTTEQVRLCSPTELTEWNATVAEREALWVADRRDEYQGKPWQDGPLWNNYLSRSDVKQTFCGRLDKFGWNEEEDAKDWNLHLYPTIPRYEELLKRVDEERTYVEAEISVDTAYRHSSPWFDTARDRSPLVGKTVCAYGAYVADEWHKGEFGGPGEKAEIHPAEFIWWRERLTATTLEGRATGAQELLRVMHLQDNSGRFDDRDNFDWDDTPPARWAPWADAPRKGLIRVPWSWRPGQGAAALAIYDDYVHRVVTSQHGASADTEASNPMSLRYNGATILEVHEKTGVDANLGVNMLHSLCRRPNSTEVLGMVGINDDISTTDDSDGEGVHVFRIVKTRFTPVSIALPPGGVVATQANETDAPLTNGAD